MAAIQNTVLGKYRILREIARSNDIVYEAIDPKMNRRVAIKELQLPLHLAGTQKRERVERFYREAKAAGTLTHPNIVTIHEIGQENDRHFLVMEYLDGQSLRDILQLQGALPLKETIEIALQLCDALSYAHAHGVVHRDVKPDNVHILPGGIIKLTDFGIARITAEPSITSQGQVFGTPSYMSPEQVASQTVDHRTDLFSLSITLYEMLTGRKPFVGDSVITITYNIMNVQPAMPQGVAPGLQAILQKGLAKDPTLRYQSAAQIAQDLRAQKFLLADSAFDGTPKPAAPMTFAPPVGATMDTGVVPSHISGLPALAPAPVPVPASVPVPVPVPTAFLPSEPAPLPIAARETPPPAAEAPPVSEAPREAPAPLYAPAAPSQNGTVPAAPSAPMIGGLAAGQARRASPRAGSRSLVAALSLVGLLAVLALLMWGAKSGLHTVQVNRRTLQADTLYMNANQHMVNSDYPAAERGYEEARDMAPVGSPEYVRATQGISAVRTTQGQQLAQAGKRKAALAAYVAAIKMNPKNAAAYDSLGNLLIGGGDDANAVVNWEKAVQADPKSPAADDARVNAAKTYLARAQTAARAGNYDAARTAWGRVLVLSPGTPEALEAQQRISSTPLPGLGGAH